MSVIKAAVERRPAWVVILIAIINALAVLACVAVLAIIVAVCVDVILRLPIINKPLIGVYDIVRLLSAVALAAALPYTTAIKGHVAIEYFFHKLKPPSRVAVDSVMRLLSIALFVFLAWGCLKFGLEMFATGQVSQTLRLPIFWLPIFIAACCLVVAVVIVHHLVYPHRELLKP